MSFDNSRITFDPWRDYFGVVMQQGRVQLDSDWNEWVAELSRRIQAGTMDILGLTGVPSTTPSGFQITIVPDPQTPTLLHMMIGTGRIYVDGILAENHGSKDSAKWDFALGEISGSPQPPVLTGASIDYAQQPWPTGAVFPPVGDKGPFLVYLDVWRRPVTSLEDPNLIEKAVGVDSTGRYQTIWQVKWMSVSSLPGVACCTPVDAWTSLLTPSGSLLTTGVANVPSPTAGPCALSPDSGYSGMGNQLYRVEIHQSGAAASLPPTLPLPPGTASFKWSREGASVVTAITSITTANNSIQLAVQSLGKDQVLGFHPGDWIELTSDALQFNNAAGPLYQIDSIDSTANTITLVSTAAPSSIPNYTRIIRWDQAGVVYLNDGTTVWWDLNAAGSTGDIPVPPSGTTLILENGVTVAFDLAVLPAPSFSSGDFWAFAARAADGSVEALTQAAPLGIHHHYCRLAMVDLTATPPWSDCRQVFPSLANPAIHVSGVLIQGVPLLNDSNITFQQLAAGISVVCDLPLDPAILTQPNAPNSPIFSLTVDLPTTSSVPTSGGAPAAGIGFSTVHIAAASIAISPSNTITWTAATAALNALEALPAGSPVLARLTLKGSSVWSLGNPNVYLNGAAVNQPAIGLRFPTGDGRSSADFQMWFWLNTQPLIVFSPSSMSFAAQALNTTSPSQSLALKNNGSQLTFDPTNPVTIIGDAKADFAFSGSFASPLPSGDTGLLTGGTGTIGVTFTPLVRGIRSAQISILESRDSTAQLVSLQGDGLAPQIGASPTSLAFSPNQTVGMGGPTQPVTISNNGNAPLTISGISVQPATDYILVPPSTLSIPPSGPTLAVQVQFKPTSAGSKPATLFIDHDDPTTQNPLPIALSGTGSAGVAGISASATFLNFPVPTDGGQVSSPKLTLSSTGTAPLILQTPVFSPLGADVKIQSAVPSFGTPIPPQSVCTIILVTSGVHQTPGASNTATMTIAHNAAPTPSVVISITIPVVKTGP